MRALQGLLRVAVRRRYAGLRHIPRHGGVSIVANHVSKVDSLVIAGFVGAAGRFSPRFPAKAPLFDVPLLWPAKRKRARACAHERVRPASRSRREARTLREEPCTARPPCGRRPAGCRGREVAGRSSEPLPRPAERPNPAPGG
ncbi:hypothetical protein HCN51_42445 [Nonomuraea sp. FMUSA5-5]|uniref:Phospholipid/glycerol acyltransferase domain-containing protein n=1 Tax=Nonomuraea composti TaxID=2720023 RepID=A0ABX1BE16_9ACTN|nr:hypothetical protein [Nonomuraea sp. FMUSA5-5]